MKKNKNKLKVAKTSLFWLYYVIGGICVLLAILFAPFWEEINTNIFWCRWYRYALGIMMAMAILAYVFILLIKRIKAPGQHKIVRIIMGIEFSFMIVLATLSIIKAILVDNKKFQFFNTLEIVAIIIWLRGFVEMINAYYFDKKSEQKYPIWFLLFNIFLLSIGPLLFVVGIKYNNRVDLFVCYGFCLLLLFFGAFLCIMGVLSKPIKVMEEPILNDSSNQDDVTNKDEINNEVMAEQVHSKEEEILQIDRNSENKPVMQSDEQK